MQKSFVVKATLCIEECQFYLRTGDVVVFDAAHQRLTVYRSGEIVKVLKQTPLSIAGMKKTGILEEVTEPAPASAAIAMVQEILKDENPDRNYQFQPPKEGKVVAKTEKKVKQPAKKTVVESEEAPTVTVTEQTI